MKGGILASSSWDAQPELLLVASKPGAVRATRIVLGEFFADILPDRKKPGKIWFYVVQCHGSSEVLTIGACYSEAAAEKAATEALADLRKSSHAAAV